MDRYKWLVLKSSKIRSKGRKNCISEVYSCTQTTVSCFASIRSTSKFCYSHPISKFLLPKRNLVGCTEIPLYSPSLFDYMDGQYTVIAIGTDSFFMRLGNFVCFTEAMIALSTFACNTRPSTCLFLALMWSQRKWGCVAFAPSPVPRRPSFVCCRWKK